MKHHAHTIHKLVLSINLTLQLRSVSKSASNHSSLMLSHLVSLVVIYGKYNVGPSQLTLSSCQLTLHGQAC